MESGGGGASLEERWVGELPSPMPTTLRHRFSSKILRDTRDRATGVLLFLSKPRKAACVGRCIHIGLAPAAA